MRIGIEAQRLFRRNKHGMDMVVLELINNLKKIDPVNEYFIFVKPDQDRCITSGKNFKVIELKGGPYPLWEQIALPVAAAKYKCDILHCTSNTAPLISKIPVIITLHDIIYLESLNIISNKGSAYQRFGNLYRRLIVPSAVRHSRKVITVSDFERKRINGVMNIGDKLTFIYNGVGEHFRIIKDSDLLELSRVKYNLPEKFFFFLGNTDPKKNTPNVLKAFADFTRDENEEFFLVMPDFEESYLNQILKEIGSPELRKKIKLTGYIPNKELPHIINLCTAFLYPSLRESFGIPILEGMACGAPVITSNTSSMPEVAGDAAILVDPNNFADIKQAMHSIVHDISQRNIIIEKGVHRALAFSWKEMATSYLSLYTDVYNSLQDD